MTGCSTRSKSPRATTGGSRSCSCARTTGSHGIPAPESARTISSVERVAHQCGDADVERVLVAPREVRRRCPSSAANARHWSSSIDGDRHPPVRGVPWAASTSAVRYTPWGTQVADRFPRRSSSSPVRRVLDHLLRGQVERRADHRALEEHAPTRAVAGARARAAGRTSRAHRRARRRCPTAVRVRGRGTPSSTRSRTAPRWSARTRVVPATDRRRRSRARAARSRCGLRASRTSWSRPSWSSTRGLKLSITTSLTATRSRNSSRPRSVSSSTARSSLLVLEPWNIGHHSHHCGSLIGRVVLQRMPSGCFVDSTWITSAPRMAHA